MTQSERRSASALLSMPARSRTNGLAHLESRFWSLLKPKTVLTVCSIGLEESVRQDVGAIRAWPFLPEYAKVVGYAFEVESGRVREVVGP